MCKIADFYKNEYAFGAKVLRLAFGILFLLVAVKKFRMGYFGFAEGLVSGDGHLAQEIPHALLYLYGALLPAVEFIAGVLLLVNKYTREAYVMIAVMYLSFFFGQMYDGNTSKLGTEYFPSLIALTLLVFCEERSKKNG